MATGQIVPIVDYTIAEVSQCALYLAERDTTVTPVKPKNLVPIGMLDVGFASTYTVQNSVIIDTAGNSRGPAKTITTQVGATLSGNVFGIKRDMLRACLLGSDTAITGTTVTDEVVWIGASGVGALAHINITSVTSVKSYDGLTTYTVTDDYLVSDDFGAIIPVAGGDIAIAAAAAPIRLKVTYAFGNYTVTGGLMTAQQERWVRAEVLNTQDLTRYATIDFFRMSVAPFANTALISPENELAKYPISLEALSDATQARSKYFDYKAEYAS